ncbi:MAG: hypothetical protein HYR94_12005, partial [Chloroflexi bacterium]|nr:hypothetical protein [Chloroflexota bacterium]
ARGSELPLPPVSRPVSPASVQRQVDSSLEVAMNAQPTNLVQRVEETPPAVESSQVDLDHLAQQVYPLIKRMLAVERERRSSR